MPGGFHPFHAGHLALYQSAEQAFPGADVKIAATNDTSTRPFPFALKEKLAQLAGVAPGNFYQVKSPFRAEEITKSYNPATTQLIFVRSEKDANKPPQAGGVKRDGAPAYLQPISDQLAPMTQHAYMVYLPTVEFGPGLTSATEIRTAWPTLTDRRKTALVMSLYPKTQRNPKLAAVVVKMLDTAIGTQEVDERSLKEFAPGSGGDDNIGDDPYKYPKPERYRRSADYFGQFEADHFDREAFDDATGEFKGYWGRTPIAYFKFDNPARTGSDDPGRGWYYEPQSNNSSDNAGAKPAVDNAKQRKQQELGMISQFLKSGNRPNPDSQIGRLMKKYGMLDDLNEFAMGGSDDDGSDGFSDDTLKQLAAQWYNGDEDPRVEQTLAAAGWEIGQDEGYDDTPGVFVVQAGDINGNSYISWPAHELEELAEGSLNEFAPNDNDDDDYDDEEEDDFPEMFEAPFTAVINGKKQTGTVIIYPGEVTSAEWHLKDTIYIKTGMDNVHNTSDFITHATEYIQEIIKLDGRGNNYVKHLKRRGQGMAENFADGRNPQDKGDAKRHGINTKASVSSLRKTAKQGGRKGQLAHWLANMKAGRAKKEDVNSDYIEEKWSSKYKSSINCADPKGFSQKAHCAGRKK